MQGVSSHRFVPNGTMTRAMFATVLYRMAGEPEVLGVSHFPDVPGAQWYTNGVVWAADQGLMAGYGSGRFGPGDPVTREQLVTILWRWTGKPDAGSGTLSGFTDADQIHDWAKTAFAWAVSREVIRGKGSGVLAPRGSGTRAEAASMLMGFAEAEP